jgi:CRP-like cAMP-binding protein
VPTPPLDRSVVRQLALFARMSDTELDDILGTAASHHYRPSENVFEQGAAAERFYVLLHGRLRVTQVTPQGEQVVIRMVNPGDLFGIARILERTDYPGTATAVLDSVALGWPMAAWDELTSRHPALAGNAMKVIGARLQEAHARVREMSTEAVERRVGHAVLRLAQQSGRREADGIRIDFPISRQDIAEMTGSTLHTVSRILSAWEAAGIVDGGRQKLLVKNPHRIMLIAEGVEPGLLS